jgi:hypothetical protein
MKPTFDQTDAKLLAKREVLFNKNQGPRVGDYVIFPDQHVERISHDWGDKMQTTGGQFGQNFYLGRQGEASQSGGSNPGIPKAELTNTGKKMSGSMWFFHHDRAGAGRGIEFSIDCRVFQYCGPDAQKWADRQARECKETAGREMQPIQSRATLTETPGVASPVRPVIDAPVRSASRFISECYARDAMQKRAEQAKPTAKRRRNSNPHPGA